MHEVESMPGMIDLKKKKRAFETKRIEIKIGRYVLLSSTSN